MAINHDEWKRVRAELIDGIAELERIKKWKVSNEDGDGTVRPKLGCSQPPLEHRLIEPLRAGSGSTWAPARSAN